MRIVGHVKHRAEPDTPRIVLGLAVPALTNEYRHAPIDRLGQLGIATGAEGRAGLGVGVEQRNVFRRQRKATLWIPQLVDDMSEEHVLGVVGGGLRAAASGEQAELHPTVHVGEQPPPILEVEQDSPATSSPQHPERRTSSYRRSRCRSGARSRHGRARSGRSASPPRRPRRS